MSESLFTDALRMLMLRQELPPDLLRRAMTEMMTGRAGDAEMAAFLVALRMKGETAAELATAAQVLREHMIRWDPGAVVLDTCGTGGDGLGTFNISTATAFVLAAAGVPVVKHGNRSVSSKSGSADVLAELGFAHEGDPVKLRERLARTNLAFCFAPLFHPAMKHVAAVRKTLGVPTLFNCLGPLANPAGAKRQLLGVGRLDLLDLMADALAILGTERSLLVCGGDGLDEVTLSAPTHAVLVESGRKRRLQWQPEDFGLARVRLDDVKANDAAESAAIIRGVLAGEEGPAQRLVLANAAAGLFAAGRVDHLIDGVALARQAIRSGRAAAVVMDEGGRMKDE